MEGLTEESWPAWTSKSYELVIDGLKITQILGKISVQLDTLRNRKFVTKDGVPIDDVVASVFQKLADLDAALKKGVGGSDERVPGLENRIKLVERRVEVLEGQMGDKADKSDLEALEAKLLGQLAAVERKFDTALSKQKSKLDDDEVLGRLAALETGMEAVNTKLPEVEGAVASVATEVDDAKKQIEVVLKKLGQVSNLVAVHDIKLGEVDGAIVDLQAGLEHVKHVLEKLPGELLDKVAEHVARLDDQKADRVDLMKKADLSLVLQKADAADVDKLNQLLADVEQRLGEFKAHTTDRFTDFHKTYDKKLEALLQWILKQLKKIANKEQIGGTDIGKVRCLVCDQTVPQSREQDVVFSSSNPITHSLKKLHAHSRPVPFENDGDRRNPYDGRNQPQAWARLPVRDADRSPSPTGDHHRDRRTSPPRDRHSPSPPRQQDHRTPERERDGGNSSSLPMLRPAQGPINLPTAFSSTGAMVFLDQGHGGPPSDARMSAFKEMELRYAGNALGKGAASGSSPSIPGAADASGRPRSAPMKGRPQAQAKANNA